MEYLVVRTYTKVQRYPAETAVRALADTVLGAEKGGAVSRKLGVENTDAVQRLYLRPRVTFVTRTVERATETAIRCDASQRHAGIHCRNSSIEDIATWWTK